MMSARAAAGSPILHRNMNEMPPKMINQAGNFYWNEQGEKIFDAAMGAAVAGLGYKHPRLLEASSRQAQKISYCSSASSSTSIGEEFGTALLKTTDGIMVKTCFFNSGSEAMEAAMKCSVQYHLEKPGPEFRTQFISRRQSYHGATIGALSLSGHVERRKAYERILLQNVSHISPCNPYHDQHPDESDEQYKGRLLEELDQKFLELGPETVVAFVVEPVVGAALGCVPAVPGLLEGYKELCDRYGALLIFDEVMCGSLRTGTMHAWQYDGVAPDIQTMGKGLGGGFPISAMLMSHRVAEVFNQGTGVFSHGQTHQGNPIGCAIGLEILKVFDEYELAKNVQNMGLIFEKSLKQALGHHPHVGNIRGRGLFLGIEFVKDKHTKEPFDPSFRLASKIHDTAIGAPYCIRVYSGTGTKDGIRGDHVMFAPAYNINEQVVKHIVEVFTQVVETVFGCMNIRCKL